MEPNQFLLHLLSIEHWPCPVCGYDLHRTTAPRCSECGHALELRVTAARGFAWPWITTLLLSAGQAGLGLLMILVNIDNFSSARRQLLPAGLVWDIFYYAIFPLIFSPLFLLILRRWFSLQPKLLQWAFALFFAVILITTLAGMVLAIH